MKKENTRWDYKGQWGIIRDYRGRDRDKGLFHSYFHSPIAPYIPLLSLIVSLTTKPLTGILIMEFN